MDWPDEIARAAARIQPHIIRTPVMVSSSLWHRPVALKLEQLQHSGSFKVRGAFNTVLSSKVPAAGVVAASGGNHGAAVAYAASQLGHKAQIFVPEIAGPAKIALIERCGAALTVVPGEYADAAEAAAAYREQTGALELHPYEADKIVAGQGSLMREWLDQGLEADTVLIAVGGGGLIAGALAQNSPLKIVGVEPETCQALTRALETGAPLDVPVSGIAANALGARRIGTICFDLARSAGLQTTLVTDAAIAEAQSALWQAHRLLVEPAGAAALAALRSGAYAPEKDERVAVLICGANPAPDPLQAIGF